MEEVFQFGLVVAIVLGAASVLAFMIPAAMRNFRRARMADGDTSAEIDELRAEIDELRSLQPRIGELEERLDFAERLLTADRAPSELRDGPS